MQLLCTKTVAVLSPEIQKLINLKLCLGDHNLNELQLKILTHLLNFHESKAKVSERKQTIET